MCSQNEKLLAIHVERLKLLYFFLRQIEKVDLLYVAKPHVHCTLHPQSFMATS